MAMQSMPTVSKRPACSATTITFEPTPSVHSATPRPGRDLEHARVVARGDHRARRAPGVDRPQHADQRARPSSGLARCRPRRGRRRRSSPPILAHARRITDRRERRRGRRRRAPASGRARPGGSATSTPASKANAARGAGGERRAPCGGRPRRASRQPFRRGGGDDRQRDVARQRVGVLRASKPRSRAAASVAPLRETPGHERARLGDAEPERVDGARPSRARFAHCGARSAIAIAPSRRAGPRRSWPGVPRRRSIGRSSASAHSAGGANEWAISSTRAAVEVRARPRRPRRAARSAARRRCRRAARPRRPCAARGRARRSASPAATGSA